MAILYPDRFKTMPGADINPQLRAADDLQYKSIPSVTPLDISQKTDGQQVQSRT